MMIVWLSRRCQQMIWPPTYPQQGRAQARCWIQHTTRSADPAGCEFLPNVAWRGRQPNEFLLSSAINTVQYNTNTRQYNTIQYNTIQYSTIRYNTLQIPIQYNTIQIQYNTIPVGTHIQTGVGETELSSTFVGSVLELARTAISSIAPGTIGTGMAKGIRAANFGKIPPHWEARQILNSGPWAKVLATPEVDDNGVTRSALPGVHYEVYAQQDQAEFASWMAITDEQGAQ